MSRVHRRRILSEGEGAAAASASLLIDVPGSFATDGPAGFNGLLEEQKRQGYDEGYRAALAEVAAAEAASRSAQLRRIADCLVDRAGALAEARHEAVQMGAAEAAELAYQLAETFLQRELSTGTAAVEAVTRALHLVPEDQDLIVRLHPGDVVTPEEVQQLVPDANIRIVVDPRVEAGGCVVVAGPCRIDTQLAPALDRARAALAELYPADPVGAPA